MATNLETYLAKMKVNETLVLEACEKVINKTVLDMYKKIIDRTPVGDPSLWHYPAHADYTPGHLKASWTISLDGSEVKELGKGSLNLKVNSTTSNKKIEISNDAPYAQRIEFGHWSTQAPAGMMRVTVAEYTNIISSNAAKYRIV